MPIMPTFCIFRPPNRVGQNPQLPAGERQRGHERIPARPLLRLPGLHQSAVARTGARAVRSLQSETHQIPNGRQSAHQSEARAPDVVTHDNAFAMSADTTNDDDDDFRQQCGRLYGGAGQRAGDGSANGTDGIANRGRAQGCAGRHSRGE